jgi:hypothetical protein
MEDYTSGFSGLGQASGGSIAEPVTDQALMGQHAAQMAAADETLIVDHRWGMTPAEAVEGKLMNLLRDGSLPFSQIQGRGMSRGREMS